MSAIDYEAIVHHCVKTGELWEDPEFPAVQASVFYHQTPPFSFQWKRPHVRNIILFLLMALFLNLIQLSHLCLKTSKIHILIDSQYRRILSFKKTTKKRISKMGQMLDHLCLVHQSGICVSVQPKLMYFLFVPLCV